MWHTFKQRIVTLAFAVLVVLGIQQWKHQSALLETPSSSNAVPVMAVSRIARHSEEDAGTFSCDGRTYCSQMNSCAEAKYFLAHCPGVKMDGDGDGIPCESQFCGSH
jgi:hypothetical protein